MPFFAVLQDGGDEMADAMAFGASAEDAGFADAVACEPFSRGLRLRKTATRKPNVTLIAFPPGERRRAIE